MSVAIMMNKGLSLRKALASIGASRGSYYYRPTKTRSDSGRLRDSSMLAAIRGLALRKPVYGSRMMAARLSKELHRPVNRKLVQHAFRIMGWTIPQMTKKQLIGATHEKPKPVSINEDWEADFTYVWCGVDRWCYLFSVLDIFSREWIAYEFSPNASKENAIASAVKAVERHPEASGKVRLWSDNGPQYISEAFEESVSALGLEHKYIAYHKPEDDPYIESFHGRLKREYIWTRDFKTFREAEQAMVDAFVDYNRDRPHSSLGYKSPYEFLASINGVTQQR